MAKFAKLLLGCYRTGDANDPEVYTAAAIAVLSDYPLDVVQRVVDPRSGLPSRIRWLPTVSEIREACQEIHGVRQRMQEWERSAAEQVAARVREEEIRKSRPTLDELRAQGVIKPKQQSAPLPADVLWHKWRQQRVLKTINLSAEARQVLVGGGYDPDGPDDQEPRATRQEQAA